MGEKKMDEKTARLHLKNYYRGHKAAVQHGAESLWPDSPYQATSESDYLKVPLLSAYRAIRGYILSYTGSPNNLANDLMDMGATSTCLVPSHDWACLTVVV